MGGWFCNGDGKFLKSMYIVGRGLLTLVYEDPPILPTTPFSNFV